MSKDDSSVIKGLAILMIMGAHIGQAFSIGLMNPLAPVGVFLFLFCSGYGLQKSFAQTGLQLYFCKKFIKVYIPFLASVILYILFSLVTLRDNYFNIFRLFTLVDIPQGSYWYLRLQLYWYLVYWLLKKLKFNGIAEKILLLGFSGIVICLSKFNASYIWQFFSFPLGVMAATSNWNFELKKASIVVVILLFVLTLIIKKTPSVESNELGVVDVACQLMITITLGTLLLIFIHVMSRQRWMLSPFEKVGGVLICTVFVPYYSSGLSKRNT